MPEWEWFGSPGHFICARWCRFHLATKVGPWLVSTVGELWPDREVREIHAHVHDPAWLQANRSRRGEDFDAAYMRRFGYEEIGYERKYETMVFRAGERCTSPECGCGLPQARGEVKDFAPYNRADDATRGHLVMCVKWASHVEDRDEALE